MIALEPARDRITEGNAAFLHMVRVLLSLGGGYYQHYDIPENLADQRQIATRIHTNIRNRTEGEEGGEPGGEHEASYTEMLTSLHIAFPQVEFTERYGFFHGLIGGLRFEQEVNDKLARYLRDVDSELCRLGVIQPTEFFYVGKLG